MLLFPYRLQRELESCKASTGDMICQQLSEEQDELQRQYYHKQMKQRMTDKKFDTQHSTASSSRSSGHYNPYTLRYIPAPNSEEPPTSAMDSKPYGTEMEKLTNVGDDDSATGWGMEVDEDDITFSDNEVFQEAVTVKVQKSASKKQLPPSNFTKLPSVTTSNRDFKRASSSVSNQQSTTCTSKQSTVTKKPTAASGSKVPHLLEPSVNSILQPQQVPKSRGISNFRSAGAQDSE